MAAGELPRARALAETALRRRPDDPAALTVLGRIHLAWPVIGRFKAESLFTDASRLDPASPEPLYYLGHVGLALGGDDGEAIARRALVRALALDPDYRDAWQLWLRLYRGDGDRTAAIRSLALHQGSYSADLRRSLLLLELHDYDQTDTILATLLGRRPDDPAPRALLARSLFEQGRDREGWAAYEEALVRAGADTGGVLWEQVRGIATWRERQNWATTPPGQREAFLRLFWARREPDVRTPLNERVGEHFRRMAAARRYFTLLHPNARYHHSRYWRALSGGVGAVPGADFAAAVTAARSAPCAAEPPPGVRDIPFASGFTPRLDTAASQATPNLEDMLDDRGRVFVRQGPPDSRLAYEDGETWCYRRPDGELRVTFIRRTGGFGTSGDMVVTPVLSGEATAAAYLLATDRPSGAAGLSFAFWPAAFLAADDRATVLFLFPDSVSAAAVLVDEAGGERARDTATAGALRMLASPGAYLLLLDASRQDRRGTFRGTVSLPDYGGDSLSVSSLLVASGDVGPRRDELIAAAPGGLLLAARQPLRVYAEVYALGSGDGRARYQARYHFERAGGGFLGLGRRSHITTIAFRREIPSQQRVVETVLVDPGRLSRGRYSVRLEITDDVTGARAASPSLTFEFR